MLKKSKEEVCKIRDRFYPKILKGIVSGHLNTKKDFFYLLQFDVTWSVTATMFSTGFCSVTVEYRKERQKSQNKK